MLADTAKDRLNDYKMSSIDENDICVLDSKISPEVRKKLVEMARPMFEEIDREAEKEKKRKKREYKPRGARKAKKPLQVTDIVRECAEFAGIETSDSTNELAKRLYEICAEKEYVVGTLLCVSKLEEQARMSEYIESRENITAQEVAQFAYGISEGN